ncbi:helix-turn-helix domain-containing protein [Cellulomonas endometrii]|uniref:helix-turn-helix domain-containing protein n=1 Tax=Cellulomonas endometrii TaxID=3036301 RepID=UPI0024AC8B73|nr:helix-turn-helix transcriptional regulator [Cellulomonas endometrii]
MPDPDRQLEQRRAFGAALKSLRKATGMSQEQLGHVAGLQRAYVGHLENGRRNTSLHTMWLLADALQVTPMEFFRDATPKQTEE